MISANNCQSNNNGKWLLLAKQNVGDGCYGADAPEIRRRDIP
jgi:hypothetical protein